MPRITTTTFNGGISQDQKSGLPNSCRFSRNLNIFEDDNYVTLNPRAVKDSGSIVTDLIKCATDTYPYATDSYFYGDTGNLYKLTSAGVWSLDRTVSGGAGQGIESLEDFLYITTSTGINKYGPLSGTPVYSAGFLAAFPYFLDTNNVFEGSGQTYTLTSSINEGTTHRQTFTPSRDPISTIVLRCTTKGTGDWTVTVHDEFNSLVGTAIVLNADLANASYVYFSPTTPLRVALGRDYHIHLTSSDATGTAQSGTSGSLEDCHFQYYFGLLIADTKFHNIIRHTDGANPTLLITNEHYIAELSTGVSYNPNRVQVEPGYKIRGFTKEGEFVVAYAWKGTNIDDAEYGMKYYWDGISTYYNFAKPITSGMPGAMTSNKNRTFAILGSSGDLFLQGDDFNHIQSFPKLARGKKIDVFPNAMENWQRRLVYGASGSDDATGIENGVYEFGSASDRDTGSAGEVLNYGYQISTGSTTGSTVKIGCIFPAGKDMYISWQDGSTYGVDKVSKTGNPATVGSWESLIIDYDAARKHAPHKFKRAQRVVIECEALPSGCTITPKYKLDRATSFTSGTAVTAGATRAEVIIDQNYKEAEYGFDLVATTNYPIIFSVSFFYDGLSDEQDEQDTL